MKAILKEVELGLLRVRVEELICNNGQCFNHQIKDVVTLAGAI